MRAEAHGVLCRRGPRKHRGRPRRAPKQHNDQGLADAGGTDDRGADDDGTDPDGADDDDVGLTGVPEDAETPGDGVTNGASSGNCCPTIRRSILADTSPRPPSVMSSQACSVRV